MPRSIIMREIKTLRKWPKKRKMGQMHQDRGSCNRHASVWSSDIYDKSETAVPQRKEGLQ